MFTTLLALSLIDDVDLINQHLYIKFYIMLLCLFVFFSVRYTSLLFLEILKYTYFDIGRDL
jgi:hypothetical protein